VEGKVNSKGIGPKERKKKALNTPTRREASALSSLSPRKPRRNELKFQGNQKSKNLPKKKYKICRANECPESKREGKE
jgi:hypothetical protein